jgi:hypothetical protein
MVRNPLIRFLAPNIRVNRAARFHAPFAASIKLQNTLPPLVYLQPERHGNSDFSDQVGYCDSEPYSHSNVDANQTQLLFEAFLPVHYEFVAP